MMGMETRCHDLSLMPASDTVLDLRKVKMEPAEHLLRHSQHDVFVPYSPPHYYYHHQPPTSIFTRPVTTDSEDSSDISVGSPPSSRITSPTFAITQKVISAATPRSGKPTRPFKAYPKDPLALSTTVGATAAEALLGQASTEAYMEFRQRMLLQVQAATHSPSPSYKTKSSTSPQGHTSSGGENDDSKDAAYWERRRKNNEAAKRSRDARRAKEDEIAIRAAFLEQENLKLKYEVATLRNEAAKLRYLLINNKS